MGCAQSSEVESLRAQVTDLKASLKAAEARGVSLSHQVWAISFQDFAFLDSSLYHHHGLLCFHL
jgi:hypothetical protein